MRYIIFWNYGREFVAVRRIRVAYCRLGHRFAYDLSRNNHSYISKKSYEQICNGIRLGQPFNELILMYEGE